MNSIECTEEKHLFIEASYKLSISFAVICFEEAFAEYIRIKHTLHGTSNIEKILCYLNCKDTPLKNTIISMKQILKGTKIPFTYQLMTKYFAWAKNNTENITHFIESL